MLSPALLFGNYVIRVKLYVISAVLLKELARDQGGLWRTEEGI